MNVGKHRCRILLGAHEAKGRYNCVSRDDFVSHNAALESTNSKQEASQLKPEGVDFHVKSNRPSHHTDDYNMDGLIVRRGQEFKLTVTFDRPFDHKQDKLIVQLTFGSLPQESKRSLIRLQETKQLVTSSWSMRIDGSHGNSVELSIMSPSDAMVGKYSVFIETKTKKSGSEDEYLKYRKKMDETFIVLFNGWCQDDTVFLSEERDREEYVMNDQGAIWVGTDRYNSGKPWYFGQFEDVCLLSCLQLLDKCDNNNNNTTRGNPIWVSRIISQMVNSNDDDGVLEGNWSGNYSPHTNPSSWTGSVAILKEYYNKKPKGGVKYGQCWVFSGVVTTLLRAIGIPTRSVTNFDSAHDTDASMTIDFHYDEEGDPIDYLNDSVWNFHVWNECHFTRPDLPAGYEGWQAIDATPQEASDGVFCCGPSPVKAIKNGDVYLPYDSKFIFGEVNGDRVYWLRKDNGEMEVTRVNKNSIGKKISTKEVGSSARKDLTKYYKYSEGSEEERAAVYKAHAYSSRKDHNVYKQHDVDFELKVQDEYDLVIGSDFEVKLTMVKVNKQKAKRTVKYTIVIKVASYTGITGENLDKFNGTIELKDQEQEAAITVPASKYYGKIPADASLKIFLTATVAETIQHYHEIETVSFQKPEIQAKLPNADQILEEKTLTMTLFFTNPLNIPLTNGVFNMETKRYVSPDTVTMPLSKPVGPGEKASVTTTFQLSRRGWRAVNASFTSDQLIGVVGEITFKVLY